MSADEFDPGIERLFAQSPQLADSEAFASSVEQRLESGNRVRVVALAAATLLGAGVALKESLSAPLGSFLPWQLGEQIQATGSGVGSRVQQGLALGDMRLGQLPLADLGLGFTSSPSMFWMGAAALVALAALAVMRLSEQV